MAPDGPSREEEPPPGDGEPPPALVDPAAYRERLGRISELFSSMMVTVNDLSTRRCPYKNRLDECTARFGCRNQRKPESPGGLKRCAGDDKLDYRSAWETD